MSCTRNIIHKYSCRQHRTQTRQNNHNKIHKLCFTNYQMNNLTKNSCNDCLFDFVNINKKTINDEIQNDNIYTITFCGHYYYLKENYDKMLNSYKCAIELGYSYAMYRLGMYYNKIEKNYGMMNKYMLMAIEHNDLRAIYHIANYYKKKKEYYSTIKYYTMAVNNYSHDKSLIKLCTMCSPIQIYFMINNKEFVMNNMTTNDKNKIQSFLNNSSIQLCQSCFLETLCIDNYGTYICGLCL